MYQNQKLKLNTSRIADYFQLTKPRIVILLAITGAVSYTLPVVGTVALLDVLVYVLVGYLAAGGAMAINNAIDFDIDAKMERTRSRASTGRMTRLHVTLFGSAMLVLGIVVSFLYFGLYTAFYLTWGGLFYIFGYSLILKRNSKLNTIIGGLASPAPVWGGYAARYELLGMTPPHAFLGVPLEGWLLGILVFIWTPTHTWAMAVKNYDDYCNAEIPMLPVVLGIKRTAWINLAGGLAVTVYGSYIVFLIKPAVLPILGVFNIFFAYFLLRFAFDPTIEEGTKNFHAHNIWLGLLFLLLL